MCFTATVTSQSRSIPHSHYTTQTCAALTHSYVPPITQPPHTHTCAAHTHCYVPPITQPPHKPTLVLLTPTAMSLPLHNLNTNPHLCCYHPLICLYIYTNPTQTHTFAALSHCHDPSFTQLPQNKHLCYSPPLLCLSH